MLRIRAEKDFWAGTLYVVLATAFLFFGRDLRIGTPSRMGAGYFPTVLGWLLMAFGAAAIVRSVVTHGDRVGAVAWGKLAVVTLSVVAFAVLLPTGGLVIALPSMVILAALAARQKAYDPTILSISVALTAFCILVFVEGLGVPMPILGTWFNGLVPHSWQ